MRAFVTHPLHFEVLLTLFKFVQQIGRRAKGRIVLIDYRSKPPCWSTNYARKRGILREVNKIVLKSSHIRVLE